MRSLTLCMLSVLIVLSIGSCSKRDPDAPPVIHPGEDVCAHCGMIISEERFAGAVVRGEGRDETIELYDDIGEMLGDLADTSGARVWVHDYTTGEWIRGTEATYLVNSDLTTPMGTGTAAFADPARAKDIQQTKHGEIRTFDEARPG